MEILLNIGKWFGVADTLPTEDGRSISEAEFNEMVVTFNNDEYKPYIAIGHDGSGGGGHEERVGTIQDIRFNNDNNTFEVLPVHLTKEFKTDLLDGKYPHVSIEIGDIVIDYDYNEATGEKENFKHSLKFLGFACLGRIPPAFSKFKTVEFSSKKTMFFSFANKILEKKEDGKNMEKTLIKEDKKEKTKKEDEKKVDVKDKKEDKKKEKKETVKNNSYSRVQDDIFDSAISDLTLKVEKLESMTKHYETTIETQKKEINLLKQDVEKYKNERDEKWFSLMYERGTNTNRISNKDLHLDDSEFDKPIVERNIYNSKMFRIFRLGGDEEKSATFSDWTEVRRPIFNNDNDEKKGNKQIEVEEDNIDDNQKIFNLARKLAMKSEKKFTNRNSSKFLLMARQQLNKKNVF